VPSGSYLASNAAWEGDAAFKYLEATYEFPFSGLVATSASFFPSSSLVHDDFNEEGPRFPLHAHLTDDLLVWMHCQTFAQVGDKKTTRKKSSRKRLSGAGKILGGPDFSVTGIAVENEHGLESFDRFSDHGRDLHCSSVSGWIAPRRRSTFKRDHRASTHHL